MNMKNALSNSEKKLEIIKKYFFQFFRIAWYLLKRILLGLLFFLAIGLVWWFLQKPSLDRNWAEDQRVLPSITFDGNLVQVKNVRNFKYSSADDYVAGYYDRTYKLDEIRSVYYIIEPFSQKDGPAHTMLSFGFAGGNYLTVSAEIRKEKGESFDPVAGILNQYEILYVVGDENDLIKLRANYRKDEVYLYPIKASQEDMQALFFSVMQRADKLTKQPEFYNTIWNTCATNILVHVNDLRKDRISWGTKILLPSNSDQLAYDAGLIDTGLPLSQARKYYKINELSEMFANDTNYSEKIRRERR